MRRNDATRSRGRLAPAAAVALGLLLPAAAGAQEADLIYDDGRPTRMLRDLAAGDVEVVRMTPEHPARLLSVRLYFTVAPCTAHVAVWGDNGGNAPDFDRVLWETDVEVPGRGWLDVDLPADAVTIDPPGHFYVGHVVGDPICQVAWGSTGSAEARSQARIGGTVYVIVDPDAPSMYLDALVRARVLYFDVRTEGDFEEVTEAAGLPLGMSRMAWGDVDRDGDDDLAVDGNRLLRNEGDGTFVDVSEAAGIAGGPTNGGVFADYDNDGDLDLYATASSYLPECGTDAECVWCTLASNPDGSRSCDEMRDDHTCVDGRCLPPSGVRVHDRLYRNEGDGTFTDVSDEAGRPYDFLPSEAAAWGDYDGDGFVDLYVANYETPGEWVGGRLSVGNPDRLWHNEGDGTFTDATEAAGMAVTARCGRGVAWADADDDGDLDLYVANYRLHPNFLWLNHGDGTFENVAASSGTQGILISGAYGHSIGPAWADVDADGDWDLFVANLAHPRFIAFSDKSMLYRNDGGAELSFTDIREAAGIPFSETHSNPAWGDYDNDTSPDLFLTDIYVGYRSFLYRNDGDATFTDVTYPSGILVDNGWGCAWADYDGDGRLDLVSRSLWRNRTPDAGHWLEVRLEGTASNAAAIGAVVSVAVGTRTLRRQVEGGSGTGTQNSLTLHFGLGDATQADTVAIRWPSGLSESYEAVAADRIVTYREGRASDPDAGTDAEDDTGDAGADGDAAAAETSGGGCSCAVTPGIPAGRLLVLLCGALVLRYRRRARRSRAGSQRSTSTRDGHRRAIGSILSRGWPMWTTRSNPSSAPSARPSDGPSGSLRSSQSTATWSHERDVRPAQPPP